jgi:Uncharacterized conserved protein
MRAFVGTSGWQYADWRSRFNPEGLATWDWLGRYARSFPTVRSSRGQRGRALVLLLEQAERALDIADLHDVLVDADRPDFGAHWSSCRGNKLQAL